VPLAGLISLTGETMFILFGRLSRRFDCFKDVLLEWCDEHYVFDLDIWEDNARAARFVELCNQMDYDYMEIWDEDWIADIREMMENDYPEGLDFLCSLLEGKPGA
jgi:hypothetical protein